MHRLGCLPQRTVQIHRWRCTIKNRKFGNGVGQFNRLFCLAVKTRGEQATALSKRKGLHVLLEGVCFFEMRAHPRPMTTLQTIHFYSYAIAVSNRVSEWVSIIGKYESSPWSSRFAWFSQVFLNNRVNSHTRNNAKDVNQSTKSFYRGKRVRENIISSIFVSK